MTSVVDDVMKALDEFTTSHGRKLSELGDRIDTIEGKANRPRLGGTGDEARTPADAEKWMDVKSKTLVPVLDHKHSLAAIEPKTKEKIPSMGRVLRGLVLGGRADDSRELEEERKALNIGSGPAGGYTVSGMLASEWIDLLRSEMVLSRAGARTVPMTTNNLTLAKLTGDPTVTWHAENAALTDSEATLGAVTMTAKTAVCLVKLSLELAQDSLNIEQILQSSIVAAMAQAIDSAGLVGVTSNAGSAPASGTGIMNLTGRNSVTAIGAPTNWDFLADGMYELIVDNVPMDAIGAMVAHPALWKKMAKLKTGIASDNTPLMAPPEVARLPKLWTTAAPLTGGTTAKAMIANWRDLLFGVRKEIDVRVLQETFMGSNLQIAVLAYARCDWAATRAQSFCSLEGITV
jgi:HK97 family phage major capsid protein